MKKTVTLWIPENLDIDAIIQQNPFGFYGQGLKKEMLQFICSELLRSRANHRKEMDEKDTPFAPLCTKYLKQVVYNYEPYLNFLIKQKVFITDGHFIEGEKCKGYCFNSPYAGQRIKRIEVRSFILKKNLRKRAEAWKKDQQKELRGYSYLTKWWETGKLKIDAEAAFHWIEKNRVEKLRALEQKKRVKKRAFKIETINDTAEDFKQLVRDINDGSRYYRFSGKGRRFYNPISNLKRELRTFLTYDGQPLCDADFNNFQPFLIVNLLKPSFWKPKRQVPLDELCLERLDRRMYEELRNKDIIKHIITLLKTSEWSEYERVSTQRYIDLVVSGSFYDYIQTNFRIFYPYRFDERQNVKREVLRILYVNPESSHDNFHQPCQTFNAYFPIIHKLINLIKSADFTYFPIMLQRLESFLVLDVICKKISRQNPYIQLLTIHDNIITTKGNEAIVKQLMQQEILRLTDYKPKVESKDLVPIQPAFYEEIGSC